MGENNNPIRSNVLFYTASAMASVMSIPGVMTLIGYFSSSSEDAAAAESASTQPRLSDHLSEALVEVMKMQMTIRTKEVLDGITGYSSSQGAQFVNHDGLGAARLLEATDINGHPVNPEGILEILGKVLGAPTADLDS